MVTKLRENMSSNGHDKLARFVGNLLLAGSLAGVGLALTGLLGLEDTRSPWIFTVDGWWSGQQPIMRFIGGLGMLVLGLVPVFALFVLGWMCLAKRNWSSLLSVLGLLVVMTIGLVLSFLA